MEEEDTKPENSINLSQESIIEYSTDDRVISFIKKRFNRISTKSARLLIINLLKGRFKISIKDINAPKSFIRHNASKFNEGEKINHDEVVLIRKGLNEYLIKIQKELKYFNAKQDDNKLNEMVGDKYLINKDTRYATINKLICDEGKDVDFIYDFDNSDIIPHSPKNKPTLQRIKIQILSSGIKFKFPLEYIYLCPQCEQTSRRKVYEVESTGGKNDCPGIYSFINAEGEPKSRLCKKMLKSSMKNSISRDAYFYNVGYEDKNNIVKTVQGFAFHDYPPGFYDAVLFITAGNAGNEIFHIINIKPLVANRFIPPQQKKDENYVFTLIKSFDDYIEKQTGLRIYGLLPIKASLIIQKLTSTLGFPLRMNVQIVGDASTGKTMLLKYYGYLLNIHKHLSTNGISVSVAGLRGTKTKLSLFGRDLEIVSIGHLGTHKAIHIDEAGQNRNLVQDLKTFILEDNYGYDKAGSEGVMHKRTAHINISENLNSVHVAQYRGSIRKAYKDIKYKIGDEEAPTWDENWDLHQPLYKYTNPYLRKIVKEKRETYEQSDIFWIDGYDLALHERFPFYFYLVSEKPFPELQSVVTENVCRNVISENLELIKSLISDDVGEVFDEFKNYKDGVDESQHLTEVNKILKQYGIAYDSRQDTNYKMIVKLSRIINKRNKIEKIDYDFLRWILETTNRKMDVIETTKYIIEGPPDNKKQKEIDLKIEDDTKDIEDTFSIPEDEFE